MSNSVRYKNWLIGKGSEAYKLLEEKEFQKLDKHLKSLENECRELQKKYDTTNKGD